MRARWIMVVASLATVAVACGGDDEPATPRATLDRTPGEPPDDLLMEVFAETAGAAAAIPGVPIRPGQNDGDPFRMLASPFVPVPTSAGALQGNLHVLLLRGGERALAIDSEQVVTGGLEGGPRGSRYLDTTRSCAMADRRVVCATSEEALQSTFGYLAFNTLEGDVPVRGRVAAGEAGRTLRPLLAGLWSEQERRARRMVERESAERGAWDYADPARVLAAVDTFIDGVLAYLPDVGEVSFTSAEAPFGQHIIARAEVAADSALAEWARDAPTSSGSERIGALPADTAFALVRPSGFDWGGFAADVSGDRLDALPAPRSRVIAAGGTNEGGRVAPRAWWLFGPGAEDERFDRRSLAHDHLRTVLGGAFHCERPDPSGAPLCPGDPERGEAPVWIEDGASLRIVRSASREAWSEGPRLRDDPDARRLLSGEALALAYIDTRHARAAGGLFRPNPGPPGEDGPLVVALVRDGDELVLELRAAPGGLNVLWLLVPDQ